MAKNHGSQIKDDEQYEALRREGASKEKAARTANTNRKAAGKRGGKSPATTTGTKAICTIAQRRSGSKAAQIWTRRSSSTLCATTEPYSLRGAYRI